MGGLIPDLGPAKKTHLMSLHREVMLKEKKNLTLIIRDDQDRLLCSIEDILNNDLKMRTKKTTSQKIKTTRII